MKKSSWVRFIIFSLMLLASLSWAGFSWAKEVSGELQSNAEGFFYNDPYRVPLTPGDDSWFLYENKSVSRNREEISLAIDPSNGAKARAVRDHLARGGCVVILVCGYSSWGSPSAWERPVITYVNDFLNAVALQVNYKDDLSNWYIHSFKKGVDHVTQMVLKARKAGAGKIRIYGHSEGSDVTARVATIMASPLGTRVHSRNAFSWWYGQGNPAWFEGGFGFGNPAGLGVMGVTVTSQAAPPPDERGKRGGFYRYQGRYKGYYYGGKFVLFNRLSDPATYGGIVDVAQLGTSAHNYRGVFSHPDFMAAFEAALDPNHTPANTFDPAFGDGAYVDRGAGELFDFTDIHFIPFIPRSNEISHCILTLANTAPNNPILREVAHVLIRFYDSRGAHHHDERIDLAENGSFDLTDPMPETGGSAIVFSNEQIAIIVNYFFEDGTRYFAAAYPSEAYPSKTLYMPYLTKGWVYSQNEWRQTTEIVLFNPGREEASAEVTYYQGTPDGTPAEVTLHHSIPAKGSIRLRNTDLPKEWSSKAGRGTMASCVVRSDMPLSGMVRNLIGNVGANSGTVYRQYAESNYRTFTTRGQNKNFAPLIMVGPEGHESAMAVQNTAEQEVSFTIRFYVQGGGIVASSPVQTLPPLVMKVFRAGDFLPNFLKSSATGFLGSAVVQVDSPASMGTVTLISQLVAPYGAESHEGIPEGTYWYQKRAEVIDLPLVRNQRWQEKAEWNSEINVVNMGTTQEEVWIQYHEQDGKLSFTSIRKRVSPDSVLNFWGVDQLPDPVPPNLFKGSGKAEGSQQKRLGAAVQVIRWGKETVSRPDFLLGYSAWW